MKVFQQNGSYVQNGNLSSFGDTGLCQYQWNIADRQCYTYNITTGDYGSICVEGKDNMLALMLFNVFLIVFFIVIGIPHKFGFVKFFTWGMSLIQLFVTMWVVYLSYVGADLGEYLFTYYWLVSIIGFFFGFMALFTANRKLMDVENNPYKKDSYTKWTFGK
jgi:hypothetical protein